MKSNTILFVFLIIFVLASECAAGHGNRGKSKRRKSSNSTNLAKKDQSAEGSAPEAHTAKNEEKQHTQQQSDNKLEEVKMYKGYDGKGMPSLEESGPGTNPKKQTSTSLGATIASQTDQQPIADQQLNESQANQPTTLDTDKSESSKPDERTLWPDQLLQQQVDGVIAHHGPQEGADQQQISDQQLDQAKQTTTTHTDTAESSKPDERTLWPDQLLQQQTEGVIAHHGPQEVADQQQISAQQHFPATLSFLHSDQMVVQPLSDDHPHYHVPHGTSQVQSVNFGHQFLPNRSNAEDEYNSIFASLSSQPNANANVGPTNIQFSINSQINPLQKMPRADDEQAISLARQLMPPPPPPQRVRSVSESASASTAADRTARPGFFTRLLMQSQRPLAQLSIPQVANPSQFVVPNLNLRGMPMGSTLSPNFYRMPLESPPSLQGLFLHSPTFVPHQTAQNIIHSPTLPKQKEPMPSANQSAAAALHYLSMAKENLINVPNSPLIIREGNAEGHFDRQNEEAAERQQQSVANVDRKMKRPMYEASEQQPNAKNMQMARQTTNEDIPAHMRFDNKVLHIVKLSLFSLCISEPMIDRPILNAMDAQPNFDHLLGLIEIQLTTTNVEAIMENAKKLMMEGAAIGTIQELGWIMDDIQKQTIRMFGQPLFKKDNISHAAGEQHHHAQAGTESEKQQKRAMICFFFTRLYRKLAGILETPFYGTTAAASLSSRKKSQREALLIWLGIAKEYFAEKFDKLLKGAADPNYQQKQNLMVEFEKSDEARERLNVAELVIELTLSPLIGINVFFLSLKDSLDMMEQIISTNFVTLIQQKGLFDLVRMAKLASDYNSRLGAALTFVPIFNATMKKHGQIRQGHLAALKILEIYSLLYQKALSYLSPEFELLASYNNVFYNCWMTVKKFLTIAIGQLAEAIKKQ